jgi:antitoxin component of MazEF toxin-antitoxin module
MPALARRHIVAVGGSKAIPLPPDWLVALGLDLGDAVEVVYDSVVVVIPLGMHLDREFLVKEFAMLSSREASRRRLLK